MVSEWGFDRSSEKLGFHAGEAGLYLELGKVSESVYIPKCAIRLAQRNGEDHELILD